MNGAILCHGCFDILHIGHVRHLQAAAKMGQVLIVAITADEFIKKPGRPVFNQDERKEMLKALSCVYMVWISNHLTAAAAIRYFIPDIFVKGSDYSLCALHPEELKAVDDVGCKVRFTETQKYSSSDLVPYFK